MAEDIDEIEGNWYNGFNEINHNLCKNEVIVYENTDLQWWTTQREYMAANSDCKEVYSEN